MRIIRGIQIIQELDPPHLILLLNRAKVMRLPLCSLSLHLHLRVLVLYGAYLLLEDLNLIL